tara:strand:+ start:1038 stop:1316 length:279 start_codon:yes stop_codon:yes gene_type:complete
MSDEQQFWDMTDSFLEKANELSDGADVGRVAEALLYAAARFNTYLVASSCEDRNDFKADRESSEMILREQFEKMLTVNLDDYVENFKIYTRD